MDLAAIPMALVGLTVSLVSMAVGFASVAVVIRSYWCEIAWHRYVRKTAGLPMLLRRHLLANHARIMIHGESNSLLARDTHKQLGKTFGWMNDTQQAASTIDLSLIKTLIESQHHDRRARCPPSVATPRGMTTGLMWARGDKLRNKLREAFAPTLSKASAENAYLVGCIEEAIAKFKGLIEHHLGTKLHALIAIDDLIHRFTLDVLFTCIYGQSDQVKFDHATSPWVKYVNEALASPSQDLKFNIFLVVPWRCAFRLFDSLARWLCSQNGARYHITKLIASRIKQRQRLKRQLKTNCSETNNSHQNPLIDSLVDIDLSGELTWRECASCLGSLVGTADTATKSCIVNTLYLLATHEHQQNKLRELIACDGTDCDYLSWVLNESLRLLPPVPFGVARALERDTRLEDGHIVPAGTFVCVPVFALHRSEEYWGPDAAEFKPERWFNTDKMHPYQFLPFGAGHRRCPGHNFALLQMKMLLGALLRRYRFEAKVKSDVQRFSSPFQHYSVPNSPTYVTIKCV